MIVLCFSKQTVFLQGKIKMDKKQVGILKFEIKIHNKVLEFLVSTSGVGGIDIPICTHLYCWVFGQDSQKCPGAECQAPVYFSVALAECKSWGLHKFMPFLKDI